MSKLLFDYSGYVTYLETDISTCSNNIKNAFTECNYELVVNWLKSVLEKISKNHTCTLESEYISQCVFELIEQVKKAIFNHSTGQEVEMLDKLYKELTREISIISECLKSVNVKFMVKFNTEAELINFFRVIYGEIDLLAENLLQRNVYSDSLWQKYMKKVFTEITFSLLQLDHYCEKRFPLSYQFYSITCAACFDVLKSVTSALYLSPTHTASSQCHFVLQRMKSSLKDLENNFLHDEPVSLDLVVVYKARMLDRLKENINLKCLPKIADLIKENDKRVIVEIKSEASRLKEMTREMFSVISCRGFQIDKIKNQENLELLLSKLVEQIIQLQDKYETISVLDASSTFKDIILAIEDLDKSKINSKRSSRNLSSKLDLEDYKKRTEEINSDDKTFKTFAQNLLTRKILTRTFTYKAFTSNWNNSHSLPTITDDEEPTHVKKLWIPYSPLHPSLLMYTKVLENDKTGILFDTKKPSTPRNEFQFNSSMVNLPADVSVTPKNRPKRNSTISNSSNSLFSPQSMLKEPDFSLKTVKGATLEKIVERICWFSPISDNEIEEAFIFCYPLYTTSNALVKLLMMRYKHAENIEIPKSKYSECQIVVPIRLKIPPSPILPKQMETNFLLALDPLELARQLTLIDQNKHDQDVSNMIQRFNFVTQWVITEILSSTSIKERSRCLRHFILTAQKLLNLKNFNCSKAIVTALQSASIHRLRHTWDMLPKKYSNIYQSVNSIVSAERNYELLRKETDQSIDGPCIPWMGLYLKDLTFINDAYSNYIDAEKQYSFICFSIIQEFLTKDKGLLKSESEQYNFSLLIEPKD
ncbi:Guanine-nucleotide dissociation stimulator CDC25 domain-containing protein [Rozella allomycis CSF55]|uniref:Guanine-nucleotide dissociation stimulator CDC25 domain-containing protein n=1 Tax=Rozella allomycis (strain CSF55) TaxID=988480 RepID=A0A075ASG3_ROZAC|nr:Guanine-nucleotide dissociation stimulator CDC25 domain-containing protein [Rozella allomycis CSF55]|eukprot:EPZ33198.1 Guanine-nucleotide dissociation stimulator CDC25 domain-containing protein [Rozella allomycis CSF55]